METTSGVKRSELWNKIYEKVKQLHIADSEGRDCVDHPSLSVTLEELFLEEFEKRKIGSSIKDPYYIEAKIVSGNRVLALNTIRDLISEFENNGFKHKGEPIIQNDDNGVYWTFMEKNNNLVQ